MHVALAVDRRDCIIKERVAVIKSLASTRAFQMGFLAYALVIAVAGTI